MADILKVTTPLINKNQQNFQRQTETNTQFTLTDLTKVIKTTDDKNSLLQQNNTLAKQESSNILMDMLKDPAATVSFIKNIFLLQESVNLLPVNNDALTKEIQELFSALMINSSELTNEMQLQEKNSTIFKGELFDVLRNLVSQFQGEENGEIIKDNVSNLLKSLNSVLRNRDVLDSVGNNLTFLSTNLTPTKELSKQLQSLATQFKAPDAAEKFNILKSQVLHLLNEIESSVLFSDKLDKISSITVYNLSRFNNNPDFLDDALSELMQNIPTQEGKESLFMATKRFVENIDEFFLQKQGSKTMEVLAKIVELQTAEKETITKTGGTAESIISSLLSSPSNYTPLLHFVVPFELLDIKAFAEMWIDPDEVENESESGGVSSEEDRKMHVLVSFDIVDIGKFELEMSVKNKDITMSLYCPKKFLNDFSKLKNTIRQAAEVTSYRFNDIEISELERQRSLIEVFKTLPYRRTGINVKA